MGTPVTAPLTGSVTTGTWVVGQQFSLANSPSGLGYMQFNYLLPAQYSPNLIYPILFVGHPDYSGMNGSSYPKDGATFVSSGSFNGYSLDTLYNTVAFRTAHPCIVVACQCDQTLGDSNGNGNFGGYNDSQNSGWNENAVNGILQAFIAGSIVQGLLVDPGRRYHIGYSLGGIGTLAYLVDNNQYNGPGLKLWSAGATFSDQLYRPATPNSAVFGRMASVPLLTISTISDNVPASYDQPAWTAYTGNTNYPSQSDYDSGGMAAIRAGSSQYYYIDFGSGNPASAFMPMNADGGDGDTLYAWLFSINSAPSITTYLVPTSQIVLGIGSANTAISASSLASRATQMAQRAISLGRPITLYELWNEPGPNGPIPISTYCAWYNAVQAALKAVNSSYKLFGPVSSSVSSTAPDPWLQTFAASCPTADGVCFHAYSYVPGAQPSTAAGVYALNQIPTELSVAAATLAGTALANKPIMIGQYNLNSADNGTDPWQGTITGAVWTALQLYQAMNLNVNLQYGAFWEIYADQTYGVIQGTSNPTIKPAGYYLGHAGQVLGGNRVTVNTANMPNVKAWGTVSGNNYAIELINYNTATSFPGTLITINPGGTANVNTWQISPSSLTPATSTITSSALSSSGITLPAQSVTHLTGSFSSTSSGVFTVDGVNGRVVGPNGNPFVGRGVAIRSSDLPNYVTNAACQPLTTMFPGINMVRLSAYSYFSPTQYAQQIQWLTAQHIVVSIEDHMSSTGSTGGGGQGVVFTGTQLQNELNWYAALATQFLGNPYVWFGTNNEPPINPSLSALYTWQIQTVNAIRATGNNTIVELEQYNPYVQGALGGVPQNTFAALKNIVFGPHYYSWIWSGQGTSVSQATIYSSTPGSANSQWGGIVQQVANIQWFPSADGPKVPVGCYEFGPSTDGSNYDASGNADVDAVFQAVNSGTVFCSLAWVINDGGPDNLGTSSGLTTYGRAVASQIANQTGGL